MFIVQLKSVEYNPNIIPKQSLTGCGKPNHLAVEFKIQVTAVLPGKVIIPVWRRSPVSLKCHRSAVSTPNTHLEQFRERIFQDYDCADKQANVCKDTPAINPDNIYCCTHNPHVQIYAISSCVCLTHFGV